MVVALVGHSSNGHEDPTEHPIFFTSCARSCNDINVLESPPHECMNVHPYPDSNDESVKENGHNEVLKPDESELDDEPYELQPSIWDACVIVGDLGTLAMLYTFLLLGCNIFIQIVFTMIVLDKVQHSLPLAPFTLISFC